MPLKIYKLSCGENYINSPKHRRRATSSSSKWIIPFKQEANCFDTAFINNWINDSHVWGILNEDIDDLSVLGINYLNQNLKIAKFVQNAGLWHGYPADNNNRPHDRPTPNVLDAWMKKGIISKSLRLKIQGGRL